MNPLTRAAIDADDKEIRSEDQARRNVKRRKVWAARWEQIFCAKPQPAHESTELTGSRNIDAAQQNAAWVEGDFDAICRPNIYIHPAWYANGLRRPRHGNQGWVPIRRGHDENGDNE